MPGKYWTASWNFAVGCSPCSSACRNCWAPLQVARWAEREPRVRKVIRQVNGCWQWTGKVAFLEERLEMPLRWRKPRVIAVNWLGDLFHPHISYDIQRRAINRMAWNHRDHQWLVLTKRPEKMLRRFNTWFGGQPGLLGISRREIFAYKAPQRIWWGATAWNQESIDSTCEVLAKIPGKTWLSLEPLLEAVTPAIEQLENINWLVVGAETGPQGRLINGDWIQHICEACQAAGVPVWVKQINAKRQRLLYGREWNQAPAPIAKVLQKSGIQAEGRSAK